MNTRQVAMPMWLLTGANGYTLNPTQPTFTAAVVEDKRIVAVGDAADLRLQFGTRLAGELHVEGATVVPGLVDSHMHLSGVAMQMMQLDLAGVTSAAELTQRVRQFAADLAPNAWILGAGWDENRFADGGLLPSLAQLDVASGGRPLLLTRVCRHAYLANTAAMTAAGLGLTPADLPDGAYGRDEAGRFNGRVYENASAPLVAAVPHWSAAMWEEALARALAYCLSLGLTAIHTDDTRYIGGFSETLNILAKLVKDRDCGLRVHELVDFSMLGEYHTYCRGQLTADANLQFGAVKLFADGAFGSRTAWLSAPYADAPAISGMAIYEPQQLAAHVARAHRLGVPVAIHAIGDAALDAVLSAIEQAPRIARRDRIVHAELVRSDLVERMAVRSDELIVDIQPRFTVSDFPWVAERVGAARVDAVCAWRTMLTADLRLCGGSDAPIEPVSPFYGMHAAVTRRPLFATGEGYTPAEVLTTVEALRLFTHDACYASHTEQEKGRIAPGWLADFTVIDQDIVAPVHPDVLRDAKVLYTIVDGRVRYSADAHRVEELA